MGQKGEVEKKVGKREVGFSFGLTEECQGQGYGRVSGLGLTVDGARVRETRVLGLVKEGEKKKKGKVEEERC